MTKYLNVVSDFHDFEGLKSVLDKFDNIICLGDIGAAISRKEIFTNWQRYNKSWKAFSNNDFSQISKEDKEWFSEVNITGWKRQLDAISSSNRKFTLLMGNSDFAMLSFFPECRAYLDEILKSQKLEFVEEPIIKFEGKVQLIFIPFKKNGCDVNTILNLIDSEKPLFVLAHCPAFGESKKIYYAENHKAVEKISKKYGKGLYFIHGHVHPSNSYNYKQESLTDVSFIAPKAEEGFNGINIDHHLVQIDTNTGKIKLIDSVNNAETEFKELPREYYANENHWNKFKPQ